MVKIYSIEGLIGSGKSTFIQKLKQSVDNPNIIFLQEPVTEWLMFNDSNGENIIEKFYKDQHAYAFTFQMMAYISRIAMLRQAIRKHPDAILITERSVYADKNVFASMLYAEGKMTDIEFKIYTKWFDEFILELPLSGIIYLDVPVDIAHQRIQIRNRTGEDDIPVEYLQQCKDYHDKWIHNSLLSTLVVDYSADFSSDDFDITHFTENVLSFILK